jgi:hypothetical protein
VTINTSSRYGFLYRGSYTEPTAPTAKSSTVRYQRVAHPRLCFSNDGSTSPRHTSNRSSCIFRSFQGKINVLIRSLNFPIPILFLSLTPNTFSILRSIMHLHCQSRPKTSAVLTKKYIFILHNLREREHFYTWCGRRARTGTCLYYNEDIFRSVLNFIEPPSSKVIDNHFTVFKYRPSLLIDTLQLILQLQQFKITMN